MNIGRRAFLESVAAVAVALRFRPPPSQAVKLIGESNSFAVTTIVATPARAGETLICQRGRSDLFPPGPFDAVVMARQRDADGGQRGDRAGPEG